MSLIVPPIPEPSESLWLRDATALDDWLDKLEPGTPVAIDSEFERTDTFFAIPGLVQVATRDSARLIEPAAVAASDRFRDWLVDADQPKWLYAMSEDLELFREWLGCAMAGALDIQIAAALAGEGMSVGYARLVEALFGVTLGKEETRSDWLRRPLSESQQRYALADVIYLMPMAAHLLVRLDELGLRDALQEESDRFSHDLQHQSTPERYYLRLRGGWRLSPGQQEALQALCEWREQEARRQDRPRSRVVADKLLLEIAGQMPSDLKQLAEVRELPRVVIRKYGEVLLRCIETARQRTEPLPEYIEGPLSRREQDIYSEVKNRVQECCHATAIPPELFGPRRKLEAAVRQGSRTGRLPPLLCQGWRGRVIGDQAQSLEALFK